MSITIMIKSKVTNNALWIIVCKIVQSILSFIVTALSARYIGPSGYGLINYAASIVAFATPLMQLGLNATLVNEFVNLPEKEGEIAGTAVTMNFCTSFLTIIGVVAFVSIANFGEKDVLIVCFLYSLLLIFQSVELLQYWFLAKLKSKCTSIIMLIAYFLTSIYKLILLITNQSIYLFAVSQVVDYLLIAVLLLCFYVKSGEQKLSFSWKTAKELFRRSKHYIIADLMIVVFTQTDKIMLKQMIDESATGYYSAALTCAGLSSFVFTAIIDTARPVILASKHHDQLIYERNVSTLYSIIIYLSIAQGIVLTSLSYWIINIIYGNNYIQAVPVLCILSWYNVFASLGTIRNIWILAENKQKYLWVTNLCGALINVGLNFVLIHFLGIVGAAMASIISQFFTNVITGLFIRPIRYNLKLLVKGLNPSLLFNLVKLIRTREKSKEEQMQEIGEEELRVRQLEILNAIAEFCELNGIKYWLDYGTLLGAVRHKGYIPWDDDIDIGMLRADYDKFLSTFNESNDRFKVYSIENKAKFDYPFGKVLDTQTVLYEPDMSGNKISVYVDVFVWDNVPDDEKLRQKQFKKRDLYISLKSARQSRAKSKGNIFRRLAVSIAKFILRLKANGSYSKKIVKNAKKYANCKTKRVGEFAALNIDSKVICDRTIFNKLVDIEFEGKLYKAPEQYDCYLTLLYGDYRMLPDESERVKTHTNIAFVLVDETDKQSKDVLHQSTNEVIGQNES